MCFIYNYTNNYVFPNSSDIFRTVRCILFFGLINKNYKFFPHQQTIIIIINQIIINIVNPNYLETDPKNEFINITIIKDKW